MSSAEQYREHAKQCLRIAQSSRDENDRAVWIVLAQAWARLAQHDEERELQLRNSDWPESPGPGKDKPPERRY